MDGWIIRLGSARSYDRLRVHAPYHAFVHTLFWAGVRPSEAAGLRWGDVDLERGVLRVVRFRHVYEIPWLEAQTGVRSETLRRHYGTWLRVEGGDQLEKLARLAPSLAPSHTDDAQVSDITELEKCEEGDLNPKRRPRQRGKSKG